MQLYTSNSQPVLAAEGDAKAIPAEADMVHRTKGMYENRLRLMSEPKKIFEYFASLDENGEKFMTPVDFIRSITPYTLNPQEIVGPGVECKEKLAKVKFPDASMGVFHLFDRDGDGKISLAEYLFFTTLLSIPVNMFEAAFHMADTDNSETLDASEFQHLMRVMRSNSPMGAAYRDGFRSNLVKELDEVAIIPQFFGPKGDQALSCKQFIKFLNELQSSIIDLQFRALDFKQEGYISMRDFAMAVVSRGALGSSQFESHLHRAKQIDTHPDFNKESGYLKTHKGVDIDAYRSFFAEAAHLPYMFEVIRLFVQDGDLNRTVFTRAAQIIKLYHKDSNSKGLSAFHINLLFFLFDKDQVRHSLLL